MVAYEREADHAYSLEDAVAEKGKTLAGVALQVRCDVLPFYEHRSDDDEHANECETGCTGQFVDVSVKG